MKIKIVYGYEPKVKILEVDSKFKAILTAWNEDDMSLWQTLVDELRQIINSEVKSNRYVVFEADSKELMYVW